jgi:magnesium-transporting ATPase (P-type)
MFRAGNKKDGWYANLNLEPKGKIEIPKEGWNYNKNYMSEKFTKKFMLKAIFATAWFSVTFVILVMALIGGNTIVDNNPLLKIPVLVTIFLMEIICVLQLLFVMVIIIEDFCFKPLASLYIDKLIRKEPLRISYSKKYGNKQLMSGDNHTVEVVVAVAEDKKDV